MIITVAGDPGSGKSTLARELAEWLGIPHYSMGDLFKEMANRLGISAVELSRRAEENPALWDTKIDPLQQQLPEKNKHFVIDSRLGFHFFPESIKIYVTCEFAEAAKRLMNDRRSEECWNNTEEGAEALRARQASERKRFLTLYGVDHTDTRQYDLVIDSTQTTPEEKLLMAKAFLKDRGIGN